MKIQFEQNKKFGKLRYYPITESARALLAICKTSCLVRWQIDALVAAGFEIELFEEPPEFD